MKEEVFENSENNTLFMINYAVKLFKEIKDSVSKTYIEVTTSNTNNYEKRKRADSDFLKERERHIEVMAKSAEEFEKLSRASDEREQTRKIISESIDLINAEYKEYLSYDPDLFLNETVSQRLSELRKIILELTKVLKQ